MWHILCVVIKRKNKFIFFIICLPNIWQKCWQPSPSFISFILESRQLMILTSMTCNTWWRIHHWRIFIQYLGAVAERSNRRMGHIRTCSEYSTIRSLILFCFRRTKLTSSSAETTPWHSFRDIKPRVSCDVHPPRHLGCRLLTCQFFLTWCHETVYVTPDYQCGPYYRIQSISETNPKKHSFLTLVCWLSISNHCLGKM